MNNNLLGQDYFSSEQQQMEESSSRKFFEEDYFQAFQKSSIEHNIINEESLVFEPQPPDIFSPYEKQIQSQGTGSMTKNSAKLSRVSNNGFKTPLSIFKKMIIEEYFEMKKQSFSYASSRLEQTRTISRKNNLTIFPKLVSLCQQDGILKNIRQKWLFQINKILHKKKSSIKPEGFQELLTWKDRMDKALEASDWRQGVKIYWGEKVRHRDKLEACLEEIEELRKQQEY